MKYIVGGESSGGFAGRELTERTSTSSRVGIAVRQRQTDPCYPTNNSIHRSVHEKAASASSAACGTDICPTNRAGSLYLNDFTAFAATVYKRNRHYNMFSPTMTLTGSVVHMARIGVRVLSPGRNHQTWKIGPGASEYTLSQLSLRVV